jgi:hypothetical protein
LIGDGWLVVAHRRRLEPNLGFRFGPAHLMSPASLKVNIRLLCKRAGLAIGTREQTHLHLRMQEI